jgi:hypothetical protein
MLLVRVRALVAGPFLPRRPVPGEIGQPQSVRRKSLGEVDAGELEGPVRVVLAKLVLPLDRWMPVDADGCRWMPMDADGQDA